MKVVIGISLEYMYVRLRLYNVCPLGHDILFVVIVSSKKVIIF